MDLNCYVGKRAIFDGRYGIVKKYDSQNSCLRIRFDEGRTENPTEEDYNFLEDACGVIHIVLKNSKQNLESTPKAGLKPIYKPYPPASPKPNLKPSPQQGPKSNSILGDVNPNDWLCKNQPERSLPSEDYRVYHSTTLENLLLMIKTECIASRAWLKKNKIRFKDVAMYAKEGEVLGLDRKVRFHFYPQNAFDYAVFGKSGMFSSMVVLTINRNQYSDCSYVYPYLPTACKNKIPDYEGAELEWSYVENAIMGKSGFYPKRYDYCDSVLEGLSFWDKVDKYHNSNGKFMARHHDIRRTLLAEYDVDKENIPLRDVLQVYVYGKNALRAIVNADINGVLKGKIIVGNWRYVL